MAQWLKMRDFLTVKAKTVERRQTDSNHRGLLVRVAATHSGIVNGNMRFYRPDRMQDSVKSWTPEKGFKRPILIGHDEHAAPVGRVVEAKYIDESWKYASDYPILKDSIFYRTDSKRIPLNESVKWIVEHLMDQDDYSGLGYIELGLNVTNPDAIDKVMRDEYLTVSVGFKTDSAVCSICDTDWAKEDKCDHRLGDTVEGKPVFLISGNFDYEEVSFVNFPADPFAGVVSKDALSDARNRMFFLGLGQKQQRTAAASTQMTDGLYESDIHLNVEEPMARTVIDLSKVDLQTAFTAEIKGLTLTPERAQEMSEDLKAWQPESEDQKTKKRSLQSTLNARIKRMEKDAAKLDPEVTAATTDKTEDCPCAGGAGHDCECEPVTLDQIAEADRDYFADEEGLYEEMILELDAAIAAGELTDTSKDAKLSGEARKKLGSKTFCGPNRSFPVPDCAHVTAARRLIGRAKVSDETKSKILACVSRKAKSLGCGGSKDAVTTPEETLMQDADFAATVGEIFAVKDAEGKMTAGSAPAEIIVHYDALHTNFKKADEDLRSKMRGLHGAMLEKWHAHSVADWWRQHLKEHGDHDFTTRFKVVVDKIKLEDGYAKDALAMINKLDAAYDAAEPATQIMMRDAVSALISDWHSDSYLAYMKTQLEQERDSTIISLSDLKAKDDQIASLTADKELLEGEVSASTDAANAMLKAYKKGLASQIVMHRVMTGAEGYKELTADARNAKVDELAKRHVEFLKDTVADIMSELKWTDEVTPAPRKDKAAEPGRTVNDNAQVTEDSPVVTPTETDAEKAQRQADFRTYLAAMPAKERRMYLATLNYEAGLSDKK